MSERATTPEALVREAILSLRIHASETGDEGCGCSMVPVEAALDRILAKRDAAQTLAEWWERDAARADEALGAALARATSAERDAATWKAEAQREREAKGGELISALRDRDEARTKLEQTEQALRRLADQFHGLHDDPEHQGSWLWEGHESLPPCQHYVCVEARRALSENPTPEHWPVQDAQGGPVDCVCGASWPHHPTPDDDRDADEYPHGYHEAGDYP